MHDFWKFVFFFGNFGNPYFGVSKQNFKKINPSLGASVKITFRPSNPHWFQLFFWQIPAISCLEHEQFLENCSFYTKFDHPHLRKICTAVRNMDVRFRALNNRCTQISNALQLKIKTWVITGISWFECSRMSETCDFSDFGDDFCKFRKSHIFNQTFWSNRERYWSKFLCVE